jgi:AcrR family transcriptional regulator
MRQLTGRQNEIIEVSLAILARQGMKGLTIKNISEKVGFRDAAVYRHFRDKREILGTIADLFEEKSRLTLETITGSPVPAVEKIGKFFRDRCRLFAADRTWTAVMFSEEVFKADPGMSAKTDAIIRTHQRLLVDVIRKGQVRKEVIPADPGHIFLIVMGSLRLLVTQWLAQECRFDLVSQGERLWRTIEALISTGKSNIHQKKERTHEKKNHPH